MPGFAQRLWQALGLDGQVEAHRFDPAPAFVPPGRVVQLERGRLGAWLDDGADGGTARSAPPPPGAADLPGSAMRHYNTGT